MADIQLIKSPCIDTGMPEDKWYMPLNLVWLASYLEEHGCTVEILDGQHLGVEEIKSKIRSKIIGISLDVLSVRSFDDIVRFAKNDKDCTIVVGGQYATPLAEQILNNNVSVDYVIRYDGEESFIKLIREIRKNLNGYFVDIPNLSWRDGGIIRHNDVSDVDLRSLPLPKRDIGGLDIERYIANYAETKQRLSLPFSYSRPTNTYSIKGCPRRVADKGCSFCSRIDTHVRLKSPQQVYDEIQYLESTFKIDYISDFSDNWVIPGWLSQLVALCESKGGHHAKLRIYADPRDINDNSISLLNALGVDSVLLGIESGDEEVLHNNGKDISPEDILKAVKLLGKANIKVSDAYVLGLIGETTASLKRTVALAQEIRKECVTEISYWNILTPLPGSKAWKLLINSDSSLYYLSDLYDFDTIQLEKEFMKRFTELGDSGYEYIMGIREQMLSSSIVPSREFIPTVK